MKTAIICNKIFTECRIHTAEENQYTAYSFAVNEAETNLRKHNFTRVSIRSFDGLMLNGFIKKAENEKRIILAVHGYKSNCFKDFALVSECLFRSDCSVLFIEQRAHGKSEGEFTSFGIYERYDCLAWLDYLLRNTNPQIPVYLFGISMGATSLLMASEKISSARVKGIIADSPFTSPVDIISHTLNRKIKKKINKEKLIENLDRMIVKRFGFSMHEFSVEESVKSISRPVLLFHGTADRLTPFSMTDKIFSTCPGEKRLVIFENSKHLHGCFDYKNKYFESLINFFEKNDTKEFCENKSEDTLQFPVKLKAEKNLRKQLLKKLHFHSA